MYSIYTVVTAQHTDNDFDSVSKEASTVMAILSMDPVEPWLTLISPFMEVMLISTRPKRGPLTLIKVRLKNFYSMRFKEL